ncbi:hypothetical protein ACFFMN_23775 [Planobispora siamensis]|uniref:hypothetical protein n=1 Tax=Planobispora siamensis TaxID=936338 RepID=UPI0035E9AEB4
MTWEAETWVAAASAVIALGSLLYNVGMKKAARQSAAASERSATASERSAAASEKSAADASVVVEMSVARRHEELGLPQPVELQLEVKTGGLNGRWLAGTITLPRRYRVQAEARWGCFFSTHLHLPDFAEGRQEFFIEHWKDVQETPVTDLVVIRLWPPVDGDEPNPWSCPCGGPTGETLSGPGHWEVRIPIDYTHPVPTVRWLSR